MIGHRGIIRVVGVVLLSLLPMLFTGCTSAEESEVLSALQGALTSLNANRSLIEQYGRDIQSRVDPSSDTYADLMQRYEDTRDSYNTYLDDLEDETISRHHQAELQRSAIEARRTAAKFMASATRALDSKSPLRGVVFEEALTMPESVTRDLRRIPKQERRAMVEQFKNQMKVRSWGKLTAADSMGGQL